MTVLVTGGCGFIGHHLVRRLMNEGERVRVLDNLSRGNNPCEFEMRFGDIRSPEAVNVACQKDDVDEIIHLAYINGTKNFYERPDEVLSVAVRGMINVIEACRIYGIRKLTLASSSEVCRARLIMPTETIPLVIPDPYNPRYSYSAGKIISEMMAIHNAPKLFDRLLIFRPFNIYGPGMSPGHVIPDFLAQIRKMEKEHSDVFEILGSGEETRSFCHVNDLVDGIILMRAKGQHMGIYNIGNPVETTIEELALTMFEIAFDHTSIEIRSRDELREGDAPRRRPDISKMRELGYEPKISLEEGLKELLRHD